MNVLLLRPLIELNFTSMKKTNLLKTAILSTMLWGTFSCSTNFEGEIPEDSLSSGIEILKGTLKVDSFDRYENLITGREKLESLSFVSYQENFQE